jgi:hypothetical protein
MVTACSRKSGKSSSISIQLSERNNKVSSLDSYPTNRKACYGINITGPGITSSAAGSCSPPVGIPGGFVAAGGSIEATVPYGSSRRFELYLFLQKEGENNPCPEMGTAFSKDQLLQTYLVGSTSGVTIDQPTLNLTITESFPGLTSNLAVTYSLPTSCTKLPTLPAFPGFRTNAGHGVATGTGIQLIGSVGRPNSAQDLTGTGIKLRARVTGGN